jgi:hypothetical protein
MRIDDAGVCGLVKNKSSVRRTWNKLSDKEWLRVLEVSRLHPELSPRLLSVKITGEESSSVSDSTVYRMFK